MSKEVEIIKALQPSQRNQTRVYEVGRMYFHLWSRQANYIGDGSIKRIPILSDQHRGEELWSVDFREAKIHLNVREIQREFETYQYEELDARRYVDALFDVGIIALVDDLLSCQVEGEMDQRTDVIRSIAADQEKAAVLARVITVSERSPYEPEISFGEVQEDEKLAELGLVELVRQMVQLNVTGRIWESLRKWDPAPREGVPLWARKHFEFLQKTYFQIVGSGPEREGRDPTWGDETRMRVLRTEEAFESLEKGYDPTRW